MKRSILTRDSVLVLPRHHFKDVAYQFRMPAGIPGDVTRGWASFLEGELIDPTTPPLAYGIPVAYSAVGKLRPITGGDAATAIQGLFARPFPITGNGTDGLGTSTPPTSGIGDLMRSGYMSVHLYGATAAAKGGLVYVRIAGATPGLNIVGGIEAAADGGNTIIAPGTYTQFMGPADASGNVEIAFNV